ncbi:hypothetical protein SALBM217S_07350 [Streptomyces griseoloalbus]
MGEKSEDVSLLIRIMPNFSSGLNLSRVGLTNCRAAIPPRPDSLSFPGSWVRAGPLSLPGLSR